MTATKKPKRERAKPRSKAETPPTTVLVLRTCNSDMSSHGGFVWPESGPVVAPDWDAKPECGHGLHGLLWGEGKGDLLNWDRKAKWLVVAVDQSTIVDIGGKVKFPNCEVVFCGEQLGATTYLIENGASGRAIVGGTATAGYSGTATAGYSGTATAGDRGTATAGDRGTATAGDRGTATAGYSGTATAGDRGTATAGDSGTATAGDRGILSIKWWDLKAERYRVYIAYVGEGGIKPNTPYQLDDYGRFVEVEKREPAQP